MAISSWLSFCLSLSVQAKGTALPTAEEMDEIISIIWRVVTGVGGERMEENEEERRRRRRVMTSNPIAPAADASHPALYNVTWLPLVSLLLEQAGTRKNVPVVAFLSLLAGAGAAQAIRPIYPPLAFNLIIPRHLFLFRSY